MTFIGKKHSEETRRKISESKKDNKNTLGKHHTVETRKKMSEYHSGENNPFFGKHHSEKSRIKMCKPRSIEARKNMRKPKSEEHRKKISEYQISHPNHKFANTSIEKKVAEELTKRKIQFQQNIGVEKIANVDFLLENKIIIQCDGCYWHGCKKCNINKPTKLVHNKIKDKSQDKQLKKLGYKIYRFWEHDINKSPEGCINKIYENNPRKQQQIP